MGGDGWAGGERQAARARAHKLVIDLQEGVEIDSAVIAELIRDAETRDWPEVVRAGLYMEMCRSRSSSDDAYLTAIQRLLDHAHAGGDVAMTALALARRARVLTRADNPASSIAGDRDLARASVLIEGSTDGGSELARAHINCAIAYGERDLWELEDEHYRAAEEILPTGDDDSRLRYVLLFNRAEVQLNWACALRELGDADALAFRARAAARALAGTFVPGMPPTWREELAVFAALLTAMTPGIVAAGDPIRAEGEYAGYAHLARALSTADHEQAAEHARLAVETIDPHTCPNAYNLALCAGAEIESAVAATPTVGLRYARHLARLRWAKRLSALAAMQSLLQAERLSTEHALLSQHAYLDDLTRLGNRRAMARYVSHLAASGVSSVAMILLDVDRFKEINDTYGHAAGDETLVRLAGLLRAGVRSGDLAVRLGGDEFVLLLASADPDAARRRAQSILDAVASETWEEVAPGLAVRASVGLACGEPQQLDRLGHAADRALYRSKAAGGARLSES